MRFYCIPDKLIKMVKLLYEPFQCAALIDGEASEWFQVTTGLKHGWTMHVLIPISGAHRLHNQENHWWGAIRNKVGLENKTRRDNLCRRPYSTFLKIQVSLRINTKKTKVIKLNSNLPDAIKTEEQYLQDEDTIRFTL